MKIAFVWCAPPRLADLSFRFEHYVEGFRELGYPVKVVCQESAAEGAIVPVEVVPTLAALAQPQTWQRLGLDVAIVITWHRMSEVLMAIRQAGTRVVAISDSDGQVGLRAHPWITLKRMFLYKRELRSRLGVLKYWARRYCTDGFTGAQEDREFVASTHASDVVLFGSRPAEDHFRHFLRRAGAASLSDRLRTVTYAVPDFFCDLPLPPQKQDQILAMGRWSDPQKDAPLLARALELYFRQGTTTEVHIFGHDGEVFQPLASRYPQVKIRGPQDPDEVIRTLSKSRSILFSSRWETGPHAATEALALGATLVGAPIPNLLGMAEGGRFGTIAPSRRPKHLAQALRQEIDLWRQGQRDHHSIAAHWRPRVRPASVCQQMLEALESVS